MQSDKPDVKRQIKAEFYAQLLATSYNKITVKHLVACLGMSRQNFYRYYLSKEEILVEIVDDTFDKLYQILEANIDALDEKPDLLIEQLYGVLVPAKFIIAEVLDRSTDEIVFSHLQNFIRRIIGRIARARKVVITDHDFFDILVAKITGSVFYAVKVWSVQETELDKAKLKVIIRPILNDLIGNLNYACS